MLTEEQKAARQALEDRMDECLYFNDGSYELLNAELENMESDEC